MRVLYLHRTVDGSSNLLQNFIESVNTQVLANIGDFSLSLLVKGPEKVDLDRVRYEAKSCKVELEEILELPDDGYDLSAYFRATELLAPKATLFLNSYSRFRQPVALETINRAWFSLPQRSLLGCSGSHGTFASRAYFKNVTSTLFSPLTLLWNTSSDNDFPPMPNPHVRTTGFVCHSLDLNSYFKLRGCSTKKQCHLVESGYDSLTNFFEEKFILSVNGLHPVEEVVFGGFRDDRQQNLLISDNHTDQYDGSSSIKKRILNYRSFA